MVHLVKLAVAIVVARWRSGACVLYYPPAGPNWTPVCRDLILLPLIRLFFRCTVFHFRAAGLGAWLAARGPATRWFARRAYGQADLAVLMSSRLSEDGGGILKARRTVVIPNGVADLAGGRQATEKREQAQILFVGALRSEKGVDVLIDALALLHQQGIAFTANLVGKPVSNDYMQELDTRISRAGLSSKVALCGEKTGGALCDAYAAATLFCLPTQYASEAMPRVVIEAMQFGLPIVATVWRGIPDLVENGLHGILIPVGDGAALADALKTLLCDSARREQMGGAARKRYEECFTLEQQMLAFEDAVLAVMKGSGHAE